MATCTQTVVFAHDVATVRSRSARDLGAQGLHVLEASSPHEVIECLRTISADCVVIGELGAGIPETLRWLAEIHQANRAIRIVFMPATNGRTTIPEVPRNDPECATHQLVGQSRAIRLLREYLEKVAAFSCSVLITGETGTGKELAAEIIHHLSPRCRKALVALNCAAIPDTLLESELFGVERGAYTGAYQSRDGRLVQADGGTLFLDELGELSAQAQAKLLRALETRRIERLGGSRSQTVDVRIIAATNQPLGELVEQGRFRKDLYFRLAVSQVGLPPLRDRVEDIPLLCAHLLASLRRSGHTRAEGCDTGLLNALRSYPWPGNIRELRNVLEAMTVEKPAGILAREDLPLWFRGRAEAPKAGASRDERRRLVAAMEGAGWNKSAAARTLQCSRVTLYRKLAQHQIEGGALVSAKRAVAGGTA
jgi:DNA-binding NtrC family response regulator